jgi:hypothetical protein
MGTQRTDADDAPAEGRGCSAGGCGCLIGATAGLVGSLVFWYQVAASGNAISSEGFVLAVALGGAIGGLVGAAVGGIISFLFGADGLRASPPAPLRSGEGRTAEGAGDAEGSAPRRGRG